MGLLGVPYSNTRCEWCGGVVKLEKRMPKFEINTKHEFYLIEKRFDPLYLAFLLFSGLDIRF